MINYNQFAFAYIISVNDKISNLNKVYNMPFYLSKIFFLNIE